ncbi:MAG: rhodanese-like domain-containing protein [Verrucomicrobiota bacterium]
MNLSLLCVILAAAFFAWALWRARPEVGPEALRTALKAGTAVLVDVREPSEWAGGTARDAVLLPLSDLRGERRQWHPFLEKHRDRQLFLYCQSGSRSALAAAQLRREGLAARNAGSLAALDRAGWPMCRRRP